MSCVSLHAVMGQPFSKNKVLNLFFDKKYLKFIYFNLINKINFLLLYF